jgi:hypothetical protein
MPEADNGSARDGTQAHWEVRYEGDCRGRLMTLMSQRKRIVTVGLERHWSIYGEIADIPLHNHPEHITDDQAMAQLGAEVGADGWRAVPPTASVAAAAFSDK